MERIFRILIDNAIRNTSNGGILIGCRKKLEGSQIALFVSDTARDVRGISPDKVFEAFHADDDGDLAGMNVSLALAKRLADSLNHPLEYLNRQGRGSTFSLRLPVSNQVSKTAKQSDNKVSVENRSLLIALVEGDPLVRKGITEAARRWGHEIVTASNSAELCDDLNGRVPDVVISDHFIEGVEDGLDAVDAVRAVCGWPVPAIILTSDTLGPRYKQLENRGIKILQKPIRPMSLKRTIEEAASEVLWAA